MSRIGKLPVVVPAGVEVKIGVGNLLTGGAPECGPVSDESRTRHGRFPGFGPCRRSGVCQSPCGRTGH